MISIFRHKRRSPDEEFDELFRSSYPSLYRYAYSLLRDEDDSRDVVSEVFVKVLEKKPKTTNMTGYLMAMVHNKALDKLKQQKVENEARQRLLHDYKLFLETDEQKEERLNAILQFVENELTPQTQRILRMCYAEKKSYKEVAAELDISIQAVNKHISQALKKLRERFNPPEK
ncbi:MAG: sigma-70 family RNA polymerase sigma factor [Bacteroidaceae bacterium]|nr:sigma-70 family RNA polymerase sigma factor [Bacteroidaceae bacterium]